MSVFFFSNKELMKLYVEKARVKAHTGGGERGANQKTKT